MFAKILSAIKNGHLLLSLKIRLRLVFRISNKNVYADYLKCKEYDFLEKKYKSVIDAGVEEHLTHERCNKIWVCWLQGLNNAPDLVKICIRSIERAFPNREVVVISRENIDKYVNLPEYIINKFERGIIPPAQFTDIIRTALLCKYGGGWIDSTVLCTCECPPDYLEQTSLFVFKQIDLTNRDQSPIVLSNWLIFSESNQPILLLTLKLLYKYWLNNNKLRHYFIYHLFFTMATRRYPDLWQKIPTFDNHAPHILQKEIGLKYNETRWKQIKKISNFHKLNRRICCSTEINSFYNFILKLF